MSISPPLSLHYKSNSHPRGPQTLHSTFNEMIGTYNKFIASGIFQDGTPHITHSQIRLTFQEGGRVKFPTLGTVEDVKIPTRVCFSLIPVGFTTPRQTIDRCRRGT